MTASHMGAPPPQVEDRIRFEIINTPRGQRISGVFDSVSALPDDHPDIQHLRVAPRYGKQPIVFVRPIIAADAMPFQNVFVETDDGKRKYPNMVIVSFGEPFDERHRTFLYEEPDAWPTDMEAFGYLLRRPHAGFLTEALVPVVPMQRYAERVFKFLKVVEEHAASERLLEEIAPKAKRHDMFSARRALEDEVRRLRNQLASKDKGAA